MQLFHSPTGSSFTPTLALKFLTRATVAISLVFCVAACSKKEDGQSSSSIRSSSSSASTTFLDADLLGYLPQGGFGFGYADTESEAYKKFKSSAWGKIGAGSVDSFLKGLEASQAKNPQGAEQIGKVKSLVEILAKTGFIVNDPNQPQVYSRALTFATIVAGSPVPHAAVYFAAAKGQDLSAKLTALKSELTQQGYKLKDQVPQSVTGPASGFVLSLAAESAESATATAPGLPFSQVFVAATANKMALASSSELLERYMSANAPSDKGEAIKVIRSSPQFIRATQAHSSLADAVNFAYFDANKLIQAYGPIIQGAAGNSGFKSENFPLEAVAYSSSFQATRTDLITAALSPKTELQKKTLSGLSSKEASEIGKLTPADVLLLVGLSGQTITSIKEAALTETPVDVRTQLEPQLELLNGIKALGIAVRGPVGPMPMPDLALIVQGDGDASKAGKLAAQLKELLGAGLAAQGMPASGWQQKDISGAATNYFVTPFGVGIYLASSASGVIISSSEQMVADVLNSGSGKNKSLANSLSGTAQKTLSADAPLVFAYGNLTRIAGTIETLQGSLAMFTGGQPAVDPETVKMLRELGTFTFSVGINENIVKVLSQYELPAAEGQK